MAIDREVYLDNAATTSVDPLVAEEMASIIRNDYGNPSALYSLGEVAKNHVIEARDRIAGTLGCSPNEIYFTSGGSESDNWAIKGIADIYSGRGNHIVTTAIEHKAVLKSCQWLEHRGFKVTYVEPDERGYINPNDILNAIQSDTILVSVMTANNEIGTIEPIKYIGEICKDHDILFHTDAVQAYGHIKMNVDDLHVSLLSASGHKFHGPKGIGFLYARDNVALAPYIHGGGQESGRRAGTENVAGIVGIGLAAKIADERLQAGIEEELFVRDYFINSVLSQIPGSSLNGSALNRLPNNTSFTFNGIAASSAVNLLSDVGVYCSAGSACNNGDPAPSHVLTAIGKTPEEAQSTLRFTISEETTKEEIDYAVHMIKTIVDMLK